MLHYHLVVLFVSWYGVQGRHRRCGNVLSTVRATGLTMMMEMTMLVIGRCASLPRRRQCGKPGGRTQSYMLSGRPPTWPRIRVITCCCFFSPLHTPFFLARCRGHAWVAFAWPASQLSIDHLDHHRRHHLLFLSKSPPSIFRICLRASVRARVACPLCFGPARAREHTHRDMSPPRRQCQRWRRRRQDARRTNLKTDNMVHSLDHCGPCHDGRWAAFRVRLHGLKGGRLCAFGHGWWLRVRGERVANASCGDNSKMVHDAPMCVNTRV
jgi:hypothetical protein